ncbi:MAG: ABC transporter permease [Candidatus Hodarchaeota archaeon]
MKKKIYGIRRRYLGFPFGLAKRNIARAKYRSILLILGITLTIALETGLVISVDTLYDDFIYNNQNQNYTDISVIPKEWIDLSSLRSVAKDVHSVKGVARASPVYSIVVNNLGIEQIPDLNILIYGIDPETHPDFSTFDMKRGNRTISGNTVIISERLFVDSGLQIGDTINTSDFDINIDPRIFTIGGVMADPSFFGNNIGFFFILISIDTLFDIIPEAERSNILRAGIDVSIENLLNIKTTREKIKDKIGIDYYVWNEKDISDIEASGIRAYQTAMNLVILVSFIVEFLFITNILAIAIRDRSKEIGILRAVGIDSKQLITAITIEILIYSVVGSILGLFFGTVFAFLLIWNLEAFYPSLNFRILSLHSNSLIATFFSGIIVSLISGLYPIFIALSVPIVQNIHSRMRKEKSIVNSLTFWKYNVTMGILIAITGFILQLFVGPSRFLDFEILSIHFFAILLIFFGTLLVEIGILVFLPRIAFRFLAPIFGVITRTISMRNIAREFQKSLLTILTSALALTFIIIVGLVSVSVISAVPVYFRDQWGRIELIAEAHDGQQPNINLIYSLDTTPSIIISSFIQEERTEIQGIDSYVYGVDPLRYAYFAENVVEPMFNYTYSSFIFLYQTEGNFSTNATYGLVSELLFHKLQSPIGSNVSVRIADNSTVNVTIASVIKSNIFLGNGEYIYISTNRFQEFFNSTSAKWFVCDVEGDVSSAKTMIEFYFPQFKEVIGIDFYAKAIESSLVFQSAIFQMLFLESFVLAASAQFMCILVSTLRMEREMGIMRSIGLSKQGVFNVFISESAALGLTAISIGVIDGIIGSALLSWYISLSIPTVIEFPINRIILWVFFSFLITLASTTLPSYRSSRNNIVNTISGRPLSRQYVEEPIYPQAFYPYLQTGTVAESLLAIDVSYQKSKITHEEMKNKYSNTFTSLKRFIKNHMHQIQAIFLILMVIFAFNYFFDNNTVVRGLNPFDIIWRLSYSILPCKAFEYVPDLFLVINPSLLIVGLTIISPITYYLVYDSLQDNFPAHLANSLVWGIIGVIVCILTPFLLLAFLVTILSPIALFLIMMSKNQDILIFDFILSFSIIGLEFLLLQKIWSFLIFRGISPRLTFRQKVTWLRKIGSKGQITFIILLFLHTLIQYLLFHFSQSFSESIKYDESAVFPFILLYAFLQILFGPIIFLVLATFEIGFFLFLIIYQVIQFQNQSYLFFPSAVDESDVQRSIFTMIEKGWESPPQPQVSEAQISKNKPS